MPFTNHRHAEPVTPPPVRATCYNRTRDLPRLLPLWPNETLVAEPGAHDALIARLRRALRTERRRGIAGHWTYNLARHADLLRAYRTELELAGHTLPRTRETRAPNVL
jgi:hypothetical protein